jgi:16S rRNA processing protein RimM
MASAFAWTWWIPIPSSKQTELRVGRLTKAHGLKGGLKLELFTDDPARRFVPGAVFSLQVPTSSEWHGKKLELAELRWYNAQPVGFFKDVTDRTVAETLVKAILWISQDESEQTDEEDAWYDHQLVGLGVVRDGTRIGVVRRVDHLPAQDLLAIETASGDEVLVPFVKAIVPAVDIAAGIVTVTPPPGLFEELPDEDPAPEGAIEGDADETEPADADGADAGVQAAPDEDASAEDAPAEDASAEDAPDEGPATEAVAAEDVTVEAVAAEDATAPSVTDEARSVDGAPRD